MNNHDENKVINENVNQSPVITDDDANRNLGVMATILNYFKTNSAHLSVETKAT